MATKSMVCAQCTGIFEIRIAEYNRRSLQGYTRFYCSRSCGAKASNARTRYPIVEKTCPECGATFKTSTAVKKNKTFCSYPCASKGSVTTARRAAGRNSVNLVHGDLRHIARGLRTRENWKYVELEKFLKYKEEEFVFEYVVGEGIFDLALPDKKILIEFDGRYHGSSKQSQVDLRKEASAHKEGWQIIRINTADNAVIPGSALYSIL